MGSHRVMVGQVGAYIVPSLREAANVRKRDVDEGVLAKGGISKSTRH